VNTLPFLRHHTRPPSCVAQSLDPVPIPSRLTGRVLRNAEARAFTLLELLVVLAILGIIAALAMPVMNNFKPNYTANATKTLMDELARARQLAISHRTTVFMVFVPTNFWSDLNYATVASNQLEKQKMDSLMDKQGIGYAFVSLRSMGDQPGQPTVRYLSEWKTLPEGAFIAPYKFVPSLPSMFYTNDYLGNPAPAYPMQPFEYTSKIPFPSEYARPGRPNQPYIRLPYVAFDYMGRLIRFNDLTGQQKAPGNDLIPLAKGNVIFSHDQSTRLPLQKPPSFNESPPGNWTNAYNLVMIDWLTGRARGIQQEAQSR